jgi:hypothetical protein
MFVKIEVKKNEVTPYKQEGNYIQPGVYFRYLGNRPNQQFKKTFELKACQKGRMFLWLAPFEPWIKFLHDGVLLPQPRIIPKINWELLPFDPEILRNWQKRFFEEAYAYLANGLPYRKGWAAPLGAGKTLAGLSLSQLFEPNETAVVAATYLHETWGSEAEEWGIRCPLLSTYESVHKLPDSVKCLIVDEALAYKNPDAQRTVRAVSVSQKCEAVVGFSGIVVAGKGPLDFRWLRVVSPGCVPGSEHSWQFKWGLDTKLKEVGSQKAYITEDYDDQAIGNFVSHFMHTVDIKEISDELPEVSYSYIYCDPPQEFEQIRAGAATVRGKPKILSQVLQCTDGFIYNDDKRAIRLKSPKIQALKEWVAQLNEPVTLVTAWTEGVNILAETFREYFPAIVDGSTQDFGKEIRRFKSKETNILILNAGFSKGMNLQKVCRVAAFLSVGPKPDDYEQLIGRFARPGQRDGVTIAHFVCRDTGDKRRIELVQKHKGKSAEFIEKLLMEELLK